MYAKIISLIGILLLLIIQFTHAEQYKFNMTKDLEYEGTILQFCIAKIEMINDFCDTRYGGIDTQYGEAIK